MNHYIKILLRILIIFFLGIIYFNYRNNQCILKQNCTPIFLSDISFLKKNFETAGVILFKYKNNASKVEFSSDQNFNLINSDFNFFNDGEKSNINYMFDLFRPKGFDSYIAKMDNSKTIAKFSITNNSAKPKKISLKMTDISNSIYDRPAEFSNPIKILNCFCDQEIVINEYETKDLFIYFKFNFSGYFMYEISIDEKVLIR
ncbi:MAG: hypothetical protein ACO201_04345 [Rickettsiales bacterium]